MVFYAMDLIFQTLNTLVKLEENFFGNSFHEIAGNFDLEKQIKMGLNQVDIRASWQTDLENFKKIRKKYLIYP